MFRVVEQHTVVRTKIWLLLFPITVAQVEHALYIALGRGIDKIIRLGRAEDFVLLEEWACQQIVIIVCEEFKVTLGTCTDLLSKPKTTIFQLIMISH